jgi:hypothetical protein
MTYFVSAAQVRTQIKAGTRTIPASTILGVDILVDGFMADAVDTEFKRQPPGYLLRRPEPLQFFKDEFFQLLIIFDYSESLISPNSPDICLMLSA